MKFNRATSTAELEDAVEAYWLPNPFPEPEGFTRGFVRALMPHCAKNYGGYLSEKMTVALMQCAEEFYEQEEVCQIAFERRHPTSPIEVGLYRDLLFYLASFTEYDPQTVVADFVSRMLDCFDYFLGALPHYAFFPQGGAQLDPDTPSIPFLEMTGERTHYLIDDLIQPLLSSEPYGLFQPFRERLEENGERVFKGELVPPRDWRGKSIQSVKAYLEGTPLYDLFLLDIPEPQPAQLPEPPPGAPLIEEHQWYRHALLVAAPGQGKTNAIRWRIAQLLPQIARGEASLILLEPKGVLTREILECELAWQLRERLVIIDPADPVAVNLFDKGDGSALAINELIARVSRVFNTITSGLTAMQRSTFTFALRALFALPTPPTMRMFRRILRQGINGLPVQNLSSAVQEFFEYDFQAGKGRAGEIIDRLNNLLADPVFEALFDSEHSTFDMFNAMQGGNLIIINAAGVDPLYGRFWIEEVGRCVKQRFKVRDPKDRIPTSFIIDEAQNYVSEDLHFAQILDEAREARIGIFMACQHMGQIKDDHVRQSIYNSNLKFIANTNGDIHNLCRSMGRTQPEFIQTMPEYHFGFYGPNMAEASMAYLPLVEFDDLDKMNPEQYTELRHLNRARYADPESMLRTLKENTLTVGRILGEAIKQMPEEQLRRMMQEEAPGTPEPTRPPDDDDIPPDPAAPSKKRW